MGELSIYVYIYFRVMFNFCKKKKMYFWSFASHPLYPNYEIFETEFICKTCNEK